jgi:hypothetical protein
MIFRLVVGALKFGENERHGFAHDIGQYIESPPMRHAHDKGMRPQFTGAINRILERRHNRFAAIQSKSLGGIEFLRQKVLKGIRETETFKNMLFLFLVVARPAGILDAGANPVHFVLISNVTVFYREGTAVCFAQLIENDAQCDFSGIVGEFFEVSLVASGTGASEIQLSIQIGSGKAVILQGQFRRIAVRRRQVHERRRTVGKGFSGMQVERIEFGSRVAIDLVRADQMRNAQGIRRRRLHHAAA